MEARTDPVAAGEAGPDAGGELIEDPVVKWRFRFSRKGSALVIDIFGDPGARTPEHFHPNAHEVFEVIEGVGTFVIDGEERRAGPGERMELPPGTRHVFANPGNEVVRFTATVDPPLDMQELFEVSAAQAREGLWKRPGIPKGWRGFLAAADFTVRYGETMVTTFPPPVLQRIMFPPLARLERRRRRRAAR
ncbi:MAG TPA: cupin domain-containing protein [Thermoleophilaceae bacterium]